MNDEELAELHGRLLAVETAIGVLVEQLKPELLSSMREALTLTENSLKDLQAAKTRFGMLQARERMGLGA